MTEFGLWSTNTSTDFMPTNIIGTTNPNTGRTYHNRHEEYALCDGCGVRGQVITNRPHVFEPEWQAWRPSGGGGNQCVRNRACIIPGCGFYFTQAFGSAPGVTRDASHNWGGNNRCTRCNVAR